MANEDDMIRRLRILYGISPEGATQESFDSQIAALQRQIGTYQPKPWVAPLTNHDKSIAPKAQPPPDPRKAWQAQIDALNRQRAVAVKPSDVNEANANRGLLDSIFGRVRSASLDEGDRELNNRFTDSIRGLNGTIAARGLGNGSASTSLKTRAFADLLLGRQRLRLAADAADQQGRQSLDEQRQATERQIKLGAQPDINGINALRETEVGVNQAYRNLTQSALGDLLVRGSDVYRDMNQADAYGRRGFSGLALGTGRRPAAAGNIT